MPPSLMVAPDRTAVAFTVNVLFKFNVASASGLIETGMSAWLNKSVRAVTKCLLRLKSLSWPTSRLMASALISSVPVPMVTRLLMLAVA